MELSDSIDRLYAAFNARNVEAVLAGLAPDVDWANGMEGGRVHGREAVRQYWERQWETFDPQVTPERVTPRQDGGVDVEVHQRVREIATGTLLMDTTVRHTYWFAGGLVTRMEIGEAPPNWSSPHA